MITETCVYPKQYNAVQYMDRVELQAWNIDTSIRNFTITVLLQEKQNVTQAQLQSICLPHAPHCRQTSTEQRL